jgi:hypothetical protein
MGRRGEGCGDSSFRSRMTVYFVSTGVREDCVFAVGASGFLASPPANGRHPSCPRLVLAFLGFVEKIIAKSVEFRGPHSSYWCIRISPGCLYALGWVWTVGVHSQA